LFALKKNKICSGPQLTNTFKQGILGWVQTSSAKRLNCYGQLLKSEVLMASLMDVSLFWIIPYLARLHRKTLCYSKSEEMLLVV